MRALLVVLSSLVFAVLPAASASASGGWPVDPPINVGCEGPTAPCRSPEGQRVCVLYEGNEFCFDIGL